MPTRLEVPLNPFDLGVRVADTVSFGMSSRMLKPFQGLMDRMPLRGATYDVGPLLDRLLSLAPADLGLGQTFPGEARAPVPGGVGHGRTYLEATRAQEEIVESLPDVGPVYMLNLLRFKKPGGRELFQKYGEKSAPSLQRTGAQLAFDGLSGITVIGPDAWDEVSLIRYPSKDVFVSYFFHDPAHLEAAPLRDQALEDSRLYFLKQSQLQPPGS